MDETEGWRPGPGARSLALITSFHFPWLNRCNITRWGGQQPCPGWISTYIRHICVHHTLQATVYSTGVTLQDGVASSRVRLHRNYNLCHGQADMEITGQQIWFNFSFIALSQFGWLQPSRGVGIDYNLQNFNALDIYSLGGGTCPPVSYFYYKYIKYQKSMNVTMQCVDRWILWIATSKPTGCSVWRRRKYLATFEQFPEDSEKPLNPASVLGCELACVGTAGSGTKQD